MTPFKSRSAESTHPAPASVTSIDLADNTSSAVVFSGSNFLKNVNVCIFILWELV